MKTHLFVWTGYPQHHKNTLVDCVNKAELGEVIVRDTAEVTCEHCLSYIAEERKWCQTWAPGQKPPFDC